MVRGSWCPADGATAALRAVPFTSLLPAVPASAGAIDRGAAALDACAHPAGYDNSSVPVTLPSLLKRLIPEVLTSGWRKKGGQFEPFQTGVSRRVSVIPSINHTHP